MLSNIATIGAEFASFEEWSWQEPDRGSIGVTIVGFARFAQGVVLPEFKGTRFRDSTVLVSGSVEILASAVPLTL